jgi:hypothetical protein
VWPVEEPEDPLLAEPPTCVPEPNDSEFWLREELSDPEPAEPDPEDPVPEEP